MQFYKFFPVCFYIFNISSPLLFAFVTMIASLIPFIGTALVWFPIGILQIVQGNIFNGIGLIIYGSLIISTIDNFIKPKFIEKKAKIQMRITEKRLLKIEEFENAGKSEKARDAIAKHLKSLEKAEKYKEQEGNN